VLCRARKWLDYWIPTLPEADTLLQRDPLANCPLLDIHRIEAAARLLRDPFEILIPQEQTAAATQ
jgi:hypothetical protein